MFRSNYKPNPQQRLNPVFRKENKYNIRIKSSLKPIVVETPEDEEEEKKKEALRVTKYKNKDTKRHTISWYNNNNEWEVQWVTVKYHIIYHGKKPEKQEPPPKKKRTILHNGARRTVEGLERFKKNQWLKFLALAPDGSNRLHSLSEDIVERILSFTGIIENHTDFKLLKYGFHAEENHMRNHMKFVIIRRLMKSMNETFIANVKYLKNCNIDEKLSEKIRRFIYAIEELNENINSEIKYAKKKIGYNYFSIVHPLIRVPEHKFTREMVDMIRV
jgi:hypothetical protein